jgi:hypothetical protein
MIPLEEQDECPGCGRRFESLGQHWRFSQDCVPTLTERQHEIITGSMMGDGTVIRTKEGTRPMFKIRVIKREYIEKIKKEFGVMMTKVRYVNAENNNGSTEDLYCVQTRSLSELERYRKWYSSGQKVWPDDISLTPTVLRHWYCQDGHLRSWGRGRPQSDIALDNERGNEQKVMSYFKDSDAPVPDRWHEDEYNTRIVWNADKTEKLFDYIGEPEPGFLYKWAGE